MSDVERAIIIMDSPPNNLGSIHLGKNMQIVEGTWYGCMVLVDVAVHVIFNAKKNHHILVDADLASTDSLGNLTFYPPI